MVFRIIWHLRCLSPTFVSVFPMNFPPRRNSKAIYMEKEKALLGPRRASNALIFFAVTAATYARGLEGEVVGVRGFVHEVGGWGCG